MLRVNKAQLEDLELLYSPVQVRTTRHNIYVIASGDQQKTFKAYLNGNLSRRQQNNLYWAKLKRRRAQEIPTSES